MATNPTTTPQMAPGVTADITLPSVKATLPASQQAALKSNPTIQYDKAGNPLTPGADIQANKPGTFGGVYGVDSDELGHIRDGKHYFAGGTYDQQAAQMAKLNSLLSSGNYRDVPGNIMSEYTSGALSLEEAISAIQGTPQFNAGAGPHISGGQGAYSLPTNPDGSVNWGAVDYSKLSKDAAQNLLSAGADPASGSTGTPETSSGSKLVNDALASTGGGTSAGAGTAAGGANTGTGGGSAGTRANPGGVPGNPAGGTTPQGNPIPANANIPFPNLGSEPTFDYLGAKEGLMSEYGVTGMMGQVQSIDSQINQIKADLAAKYQSIMGVGSGVSTRVSSKEYATASKNASMQISALNAQKTQLNNQISYANKTISMLMTSEQKDYSTAHATWQRDYNANMSYINNLDKGLTLPQKQDKAALTTALKYLKDTPYSSLTKDHQNMIEQLTNSVYGPQFQGLWDAGLDFSATVYTGTFKGADGSSYLQKLDLNPDGSLSVQYVKPQAATPMTSVTKITDLNKAADYLDSIIDPNTGYINGADFTKIRSDWASVGGDESAFNGRFGHLLAPGDKVKYGLTAPASAHP